MKKLFLSGCDIIVDKMLQDCLQTLEDNESLLQTLLHQLQTTNDAAVCYLHFIHIQFLYFVCTAIY